MVKHEAYAVRAQWQTLVAREEPELDGAEAPLPDDERLLRFDRLTKAATPVCHVQPATATRLPQGAEKAP